MIKNAVFNMLKMGFKTTPKEIELYLKREAARDIEQDKRHDLLRVEEKNKLIGLGSLAYEQWRVLED